MTRARPTGCILVRPGETAEGTTGFSYAAGISAASTGSRGLSLQLASLPPGARARAHKHDRHESAAYVLEGELVVWSGQQLEEKLVVGPGDFVYIPSGLPHLVANRSDSAPALAVLARTDPNEQEDVTELPELESLVQLHETS
jgi:uncharacterized RmlC-like cupin family protein